MDRLRIQNQNIEKLAKLGYWEWWPNSKQITLSAGFINLFNFIDGTISPSSILTYLRKYFTDREHIEFINYLRNIKKNTFPGIKTFAIPMNDDSVKYFEVNAFSTENNGEVCISGTIQEVTERIKYSIIKEKELVFEKRIAEIASRFVNDIDFELTISSTLNELGELCNAEQVELIRIENDSLSEEYQWKNSISISNCFIQKNVPPSEIKYFIDLIKNSKLIYYQSLLDFPDRLPVLKTNLFNNGVNSLIISGIQKDQQTVGSLIISRKSKTIKWDFSDIHMVKMTSLILSNGLKQNFMHKSLKKSEKRLKFALLAGNLGTYEYDLHSQKRYCDERIANIFGFSCGTLNNMKNWLQNNIHPDHSNVYQNCITQCLEGENNYFEQEYKIRCKDGKYKWISDWGIVTEVNSDGEPLKMVGIIQDISNRKNTEEALIIAKEKAEENEKLKTAFLANVSHEIRTPMNGITGFAELLYNNMVSDNDKHHYLEIIWKNSNRLLALINNILDISKLETKQMVIYENECSLDQIITDLTRQFSTRLELNKNIEFIISAGFDIKHLKIKTDESRLKQILANLIENAFKFTLTGYIELQIEINKMGDLQFRVKDTGTGIPREFHNQLFNRFSQSELTIKQNMGGSGLGLPISKGLVHALGGCIWVKSLKGVGSTFYFTIPFIPAIKANEN